MNPETSTEDTASDRDTGGLGLFSHGSKSLSHQHWVEQVLRAGSFGLHCTEAAEANHKTCMRLASYRVRHLGDEKTKSNMMDYLCWHNVFQELQQLHFPPIPPRLVASSSEKLIKVPLREVIRSEDGTTTLQVVSMGDELSSVQQQSRFLHEQVRVAKVELLDLLCEELDLHMNVESYNLLATLDWKFGQHLVAPGGRSYWSTDTQFPHKGGYGIRHRRRDVFQLCGSEWASVTLPDGTVVQKQTGLACESLCFIQLSGPTLTSMRIPARLMCDEFKFYGRLTFLLGRYLCAHPGSWARDTKHRPVCPGPLRVNHCLWTYAKTATPRRVMINRDGSPSRAFVLQKHLFGSTDFQQRTTRSAELHAWYCLVHYECILEKMHATREFDMSGLPTDTWLQTVTII